MCKTKSFPSQAQTVKHALEVLFAIYKAPRMHLSPIAECAFQMSVLQNDPSENCVSTTSQTRPYAHFGSTPTPTRCLHPYQRPCELCAGQFCLQGSALSNRRAEREHRDTKRVEKIDRFKTNLCGASAVGKANGSYIDCLRDP
uniref:Uncharacterized protein n=1 Tax=Rhodosorus marinus TaxID=101924 RepID=A0A7S2ZZG6_9RHOD|mmetsp:Transcript_3894/g.16702  ORF Transcript_3894/g.16702 Transcript_3894/m.16702 type:complete len:143 (+) Transcript_3894:166-594(+)